MVIELHETFNYFKKKNETFISIIKFLNKTKDNICCGFTANQTVFKDKFVLSNIMQQMQVLGVFLILFLFFRFFF